MGYQASKLFIMFQLRRKEPHQFLFFHQCRYAEVLRSETKWSAAIL